MLYSPHAIHKTRPLPRTQSGFTIVELSVAVAIAGVLLVSAIALVQVVLRQTRANDLVSSIPRTLTQIDKMYARSANFNGLTTQVAIGFGAFDGAFDITGPANNRVATHRFGYQTLAQAANNFRGPTAAAGGAAAGGAAAGGAAAGGAAAGGAAAAPPDASAYAVIYAGIPRAACADVVSSAAASGVLGLLVAPEAVVGTPAFTVDNALTLRMAMFEGTVTAPPAGSVRVKGTVNNSALDVAAMSGGTACGTNNDTVTIAMVNWK
ncbi:prepilin-type cleavage/methylation domain-containing protein [Herbaspirillum sp. BH-1]|uniref:Prepilin-type N-terminal cleavage/methylation domain-containing protein n=1 Tax=Herbaspirillum frisingense TaxID=92645 RepID=A0ABU1PDT7_9BURK|nr:MULTISPECIES: prepilin-type N-terminal cleavage/methylation domain-containing protein [Herbaspirillum]MDR6584079.1 prepilin-type N-terminal cleavage/methylation domain-containing protein [Herbaspirillum frisingense]PLY57275.1 prepilin-type cleavage/methylation domain-containing protein [Herbaspirillum sp. BH-1]